jgi:hypothetical protein
MEDLFAANPRNLKLPTTGPALLPICPSLGNNRQSDKADHISGLPILASSDFGPSRWPLRPLL